MTDAKDMTTIPVLPMWARLEFVHALTQSACDDLAIRALHFKGRAAEVSLALSGRDSVDVDVLVRPADRERLVVLLTERGWVVDSTPDRFGLSGHAVVLVHRDWGCTIDLHDRFPGIGVPAEEAFDRLWLARTCTTIGGRTVAVPGQTHHWLLLALHAARGRGEGRAIADLDRLREALMGDARTSLLAEARTLGAEPAVSAVLPAWLPAASGPELLHWRLRAEGATGVELWLTRLLATSSTAHRGRVIWSALFPGRRALEASTRKSDLRGVRVAVAWMRRLRRGLLLAPVAVLHVRQAQVRQAALSPGTVTARNPGVVPPAPRGASAGRSVSVALPGHLGFVDGTDGCWVAHLNACVVVALTPSAALMWRSMVIHGLALAAAVDQLRRAFKVDDDELLLGVNEVVRQWCDLELLSPSQVRELRQSNLS